MPEIRRRSSNFFFMLFKFMQSILLRLVYGTPYAVTLCMWYTKGSHIKKWKFKYLSNITAFLWNLLSHYWCIRRNFFNVRVKIEEGKYEIALHTLQIDWAVST